MHENETVILTRDVEAAIVPAGKKVTLQRGEQAHITQSLGGTYTVVVNGNMFRIVNRDADALGFEVAKAAENLSGQPRTKEELEKEVWNLLKTCYDPEIPVNIVDLGLVYSMQLEPLPTGGSNVQVKMTLTAPGCGMGGVIAGDAQQKLLSLPGVSDANVEIVWEPQWHHSMITEQGRKVLGLD